MERQRRVRQAVQRGLGSGREAARRVRTWTRTPIGCVVIAAGILVGAGIIFLALLGAPLLYRDTPVSRVIDLSGRTADPDAASPAFPDAARLATGATLQAGAGIEILNNGDELFPALWRDLRASTRSVAIVNYYASAGEVADSLAKILIERARGGVPVFYLYDPVGSGALPDEWFDRLRAGGVRVAVYHPVRWYRLDRANHRTHVRSIVIDGTVAYTGGYGFDDRWLGDGRSPHEWRDMNVRVTGPPVRVLQSVFVAQWADAASELLVDDVLASAPVVTAEVPSGADTTAAEAVTTALAGVMFSRASAGSSVAERTLALSIAAARRTLFITNAYFVPDDDFVRMLCEVAARRTDVRVLTNSSKSDVPIVWRAGRHRYEGLLACGVRMYEYQPTVLHSKAMVVDGVWSMIGTVNFDNRSLSFNDEVTLLAWDSAIAARMDSLFVADLEFARELELERFRTRSFWQKLRERGADLVSRWL